MPAPGPLHVTSRVLASLLGGYGFVWAFSALSICLLVAAGMAYQQAWTLVMMLAFLVFLGVLLWSFATASLVRVVSVLAGGAAAMGSVAWFLSRQLLP